MKKFLKEKERVEGLCKKCKTLLSKSDVLEIKKLHDEFDNFLKENKKQEKLTISFIGQYGSGKSTLIKALTGDRSIKTGADITTDKINFHPWRDVLLVDTPGVCADRPDLDEVSREQITKSDLLVFVITNELFNPTISSFFEQIVNDKQRVGQLQLVFNKMSRETGTKEVLLKSLCADFGASEKLRRYHPDDFYICFIDAESYLEGEKEDSNFDDFLTKLDKLIKRNGLISRLATPLHKALDTTEQAENILSTDDKPTKDLLQFFQRKDARLRASETRLQNALRSVLNELEHDIKMQSEEVASLMDGSHTKEEINKRFALLNKEIEGLLSKACKEMQDLAEREMKRLQTEIEELGGSALGRQLEKEIFIKMPNQGEVGSVSATDKKETALTETILTEGLKIFKSSPILLKKIDRELVYTIGKSFGFKFKPYSAVKIAQRMSKCTVILAGVGTILEILMNLKEKKEREREEQKLYEARENFRRERRSEATRIRQEYEENIKEGIGYYKEELSKIEGIKKKAAEKEHEKSAYLGDLSVLKQEMKTTLSKLLTI